jgi:hypothetical protein
VLGCDIKGNQMHLLEKSLKLGYDDGEQYALWAFTVLNFTVFFEPDIQSWHSWWNFMLFMFS